MINRLILNKHFYFLLACFLLELLCLSLYSFSSYFFSILYFVAGLSIVFIPVFYSSKNDSFLPKRNNWERLLYLIVFLILSNWLLNVFKLHIKGSPLKREASDMLLYIKVMAERFLNGNPDIYAKVVEVWGVPFDAVYLPAMWLPYSLPIKIGADLRWASFFSIVFSFALVFYILINKNYRWFIVALIIPLIALFINELLRGGAWYFTYTEEGVAAFYYSLLCFSLLSKKWRLAGISIGLCLLSRFTLILFLPAIFLLLFSNNKQQLKTLFFYTLFSVVGLLLFSGTSDEILTILAIPFKYQEMINQPISAERLAVLNQNLGLFKFFLFMGESAKKLAVPITVLATCISAIYLKINKQNILTIEYQILYLLKLTLVVFFNFLVFPNTYLLYTSSFVSLFIITSVSYNTEPKGCSE